MMHLHDEFGRWRVKQKGQNVLFPVALVPFKKIRAWECLDEGNGEYLADNVRSYHVPDFSQWKQEDAFETAFGELMRDLRAGSDGATKGGPGEGRSDAEGERIRATE